MPQQPEYSTTPQERATPFASMPESDEINLVDLWRFLMRYKWVIVLCTFLGGATAVVIALNMPPIYRAAVLMAPVKADGGKNRLASLAGQFGGLATMAGFGGGGGDSVMAIATLKSRAFAAQFVRDNNLLPVWFDKLWDPVNKKWIDGDPEKIPGMWDAYKVYERLINVDEDTTSGLVSLSVEWRDPELAAQWANDLVKRLNAHLRAQAVSESEKNLAYLREQLAKAAVVDVKQSVSGLVEGEIKKAMLANGSDEYAFRVIDPAVVPKEKSKPNRRLIVSFGVIAGFSLGVFLSLLLNFSAREKRQEAV